MPDLEAVGDAVTGGIVGRAVEPKAGEAADGHTHETNCLNCGAPLAGDYCHDCGQKAHVHRTLSAFFHDFLHGVLHFEGKIWRTLPMLAWRPGELTRSYIDGQRARFISPIALFLFSVFLLFAVASLTGGLSTGVSQPEMRAELAANIAKNDAQLATLQKDRDTAVRAGRPTGGLDAKIDDLQSETAVMRGLSSGDFVPSRTMVDSDELPAWISRPIEKVGRNPELTLYKLKTNAYKFSWALIPISVPFVWLLFPFSRRFRMYDHTVFVTYSLSFMSMLAVLAMLLGSIGLGTLAGLLFFVPPFHIYRQLKGAYRLGRTSALIRTAVLVIFAMIALSFFFVALFGLGLLD
ncbi:MAG TPA: DUF3667 domain-containing protein [Sphingomicrobium sp.]|nr:DUF3667 domain-containing protein [Sphingomicrobium sp.]